MNDIITTMAPNRAFACATVPVKMAYISDATHSFSD